MARKKGVSLRQVILDKQLAWSLEQGGMHQQQIGDQLGRSTRTIQAWSAERREYTTAEYLDFLMRDAKELRERMWYLDGQVEILERALEDAPEAMQLIWLLADTGFSPEAIAEKTGMTVDAVFEAQTTHTKLLNKQTRTLAKLHRYWDEYSFLLQSGFKGLVAQITKPGSSFNTNNLMIFPGVRELYAELRESRRMVTRLALPAGEESETEAWIKQFGVDVKEPSEQYGPTDEDESN